MSSNGKKLVLLVIFISYVVVFDFGQNLILILKFFIRFKAQSPPRWNFMINQSGIQCNIFWENKSEDENSEPKTLEKAEQWLQEANETDPDSINPEEMQKTIQSLIEIITDNNIPKTDQPTSPVSDIKIEKNYHFKF